MHKSKRWSFCEQLLHPSFNRAVYSTQPKNQITDGKGVKAQKQHKEVGWMCISRNSNKYTKNHNEVYSILAQNNSQLQ